MSNKLTIVFSSFFATVAWIYGLIHTPEIREVPVEVPAQTKEFREALKDAASAYGVPQSIAFAMAHQESGGRMNAIRFEPGQVERARKLTKASGEQLRMYASSHCSLQVMGWHTAAYKLTWSDLYNPETCAEVGMKIMADCMARHKEKEPVKRIHGALACYNGSEVYANTVLNRLGQKLLETHLTEQLHS